jgi:hypothetical protein
MGFNETCGYLHTLIGNKSGYGIGLQLDYDSHYCKYFEKKNSFWTIEVSDELRNKFTGNSAVYVDNIKVESSDLQGRIEVPAGLGTHTIEIR